MATESPLPEQCTITLLGDLMLGRLVDQLLPTHVNEPDEAAIVSHFRQGCPRLQNYTHSSPWGNWLSLFRESSLVFGNLETSVTTHNIKWPNKVFNYRMHPDNLRCLTEGKIAYVSLANNHTLDFSEQGLLDTMSVLKYANVAFAGAGETTIEASKPARVTSKPIGGRVGASTPSCDILVYSYSDHPSDWAGVDKFNYLAYTSDFKLKLKEMTNATETSSLKMMSVHWGPNYRWQPDHQIRDMAHYLIDECLFDVIWGHSSHHIQGVEVYKGKLIIYGCGDFVDDYAVNQEYRNDLSAAWTLKADQVPNDSGKSNLKISRLEVRPNRIEQFQANLLDKADPDHKWVVEKFRALSKELGTNVEDDLGSEGQIIVDLTKH